MSFWQKVKNTVSFRYLFFGLFLFAAVLIVHYFDSAEDIKVTFDDTAVTVKEERYQLMIPYDMIERAELVDMPEEGTTDNGRDNMVVRTGTWVNEAWGEYCVCADLDATQCIVAHLTDGRIFVFSRKSNAETLSIYETLQTYLGN